MTKEELVRQAARCFPSKVTTVKEEKAFIEGFVRGAEWMQEKMRESNEGQALLYAVKKTAERTKREMIEKATQFIYDTIFGWTSGSITKTWNQYRDEYVDRLKQAMEE